MFKRIFTISLLFALVIGSNVFSQSLRSFDINPNLPDREIKPSYPITEATWDVEFNYDASAVTGAAGNAGAVYIPTIGKFWTSRWATGVIHQWNTNGTLDQTYTLPFTGTRGMCFDGTFVYHSINTTTVQIVDPATRTVVGTVPVVGAPNGARFITYNPDANSIIVGNWTSPNLNFYEFSMTGTLLRTITSTVTGVYGIAYDKWSPGGPFLWVWGQGAGAGTPQNIQQMNYTTGVYTGVQHDVKTDVGIGQPTTGIAGGLFITDQLITGEATLGGVMQGTPDLFFGYEIATTGPPCPVGPATNPSPASGATGISITAPGNATWTNGANTTQVEVFFGPVGNVISVYSGAPITSYTIPTPLQYATTYQWRVVCKNATCSGSPVATWTFTTMADPLLASLFYDDFESGTTKWTITNDGGTCLWQIFNSPYPNAYTLPTGSSGGVFSADADECGSGTTLLSTATFANPVNTVGVAGLHLRFLSDWNAIDTEDSCFVEASTNGTTWTRLLTYGSVDVRNTVVDLDLSAFQGFATVWVRFVSIQPGWDWWWAIDNVLLEGVIPVELTSFAATTDDRNVTLNWSTATELNNSGFQIERSNGSAFENVGFVAGHGTTTETQNYSYSDQNVNAGSYSYRLKQIDFNGTFEYSNVIEVEVVGVKEFTLGQNYPNPFNPGTTINFSLAVDSKVSLKIFDVLGQEVATLVNGRLAAGNHPISFNASLLNSGVYFYRIDANGIDGQKFSSTKKMILTK